MSTVLQFPAKAAQANSVTAMAPAFATQFPACVAAVDAPVTLWEHSFPNVMTLVLDTDESALLGLWDAGYPCFVETSAQCTVQVFRVGPGALDPAVAVAALASIQASAPKESWGLTMKSGSFVGFIYEGREVKGEPAGFLCFSLELEKARGKIRSLFVHYDLLFVKPQCRSRLLGRLASAAMGEWFLACKLAGAHVRRTGFDLYYMAEIESRGGLICSLIMASHLEILFDYRQDGADFAEWRIKSIDIEHEPPGGMFAAMPKAWTEEKSLGAGVQRH